MHRARKVTFSCKRAKHKARKRLYFIVLCTCFETMWISTQFFFQFLTIRTRGKRFTQGRREGTQDVRTENSFEWNWNEGMSGRSVEQAGEKRRESPLSRFPAVVYKR